jgi:hypothetical protein
LTVNLTTGFSSANFHAYGLSQRPNTNNMSFMSIRQATPPTATTMRILTMEGGGAAHDSTYASWGCSGDFA